MNEAFDRIRDLWDRTTRRQTVPARQERVVGKCGRQKSTTMCFSWRQVIAIPGILTTPIAGDRRGERRRYRRELDQPSRRQAEDRGFEVCERSARARLPRVPVGNAGNIKAYGGATRYFSDGSSTSKRDVGLQAAARAIVLGPPVAEPGHRD